MGAWGRALAWWQALCDDQVWRVRAGREHQSHWAPNSGGWGVVPADATGHVLALKTCRAKTVTNRGS